MFHLGEKRRPKFNKKIVLTMPYKISIQKNERNRNTSSDLGGKNKIKKTCISLNWCVKKCPIVQALRLCTGRTAHRGSRDIALLFYDQRH